MKLHEAIRAGLARADFAEAQDVWLEFHRQEAHFVRGKDDHYCGCAMGAAVLGAGYTLPLGQDEWSPEDIEMATMVDEDWMAAVDSMHREGLTAAAIADILEEVAPHLEIDAVPQG